VLEFHRNVSTKLISYKWSEGKGKIIPVLFLTE